MNDFLDLSNSRIFTIFHWPVVMIAHCPNWLSTGSCIDEYGATLRNIIDMGGLGRAVAEIVCTREQ